MDSVPGPNADLGCIASFGCSFLSAGGREAAAQTKGDKGFGVWGLGFNAFQFESLTSERLLNRQSGRFTPRHGACMSRIGFLRAPL